MAERDVTVPDLGDFDKVPVVEVLIANGDAVEEGQSLITLESDKASLEVPSPAAGTIASLRVGVGDEVSEGDLIATLKTAESAVSTASETTATATVEDTTAQSTTSSEPAPETAAYDTELVVIGSGPGGYTAAFRAADLGLDVTLVERYEQLGGVCLNVGCIPSKALLHAAEVIDAATGFADHGIAFSAPKIDPPKLRAWQQSVVGQLTGGLAGMAKKRKVKVLTGTARFEDAHTLMIGDQRLRFAKAIIAVGSQPVELPFLPHEDPRVMDSTAALELDGIPERLLVIGGGIIGMEMACVYQALGSKVTVVELLDQLMPGADQDLLRPLTKHLKPKLEAIHLGVKVTAVTAADDGLHVQFAGDKAPDTDVFDKVLVAVGRTPNGGNIHADKAGVVVDERGFIPVDRQLRTNVGHIFAIGDVIGQPMLAHKATHEAKVAAEVAAGERAEFDARVIPSVAYTDPEVAWVGLTEAQAKADGIEVGVGKFPWAASGRALGMGRSEGLTKLIFDPKTDRLLGAGIVGPHAGDLIAEATFAIEMGATASDIGLSIHPHPTLAETVALAAEVFEGTVTDIYAPKR